ncbi:unnamed protein product, partial [Larinioides sclopetarius]
FAKFDVATGHSIADLQNKIQKIYQALSCVIFAHSIVLATKLVS